MEASLEKEEPPSGKFFAFYSRSLSGKLTYENVFLLLSLFHTSYLQENKESSLHRIKGILWGPESNLWIFIFNFRMWHYYIF